MTAPVSDGTNPFILLARITVSPGKLDAYLDLAAGVDAEVEASEPGMLFHNFDQDSTDPHKLVWSEVYRQSDDFLFHADNPPVVDYVGKHADLAESFTIEIYGTVSQAVIDKINDLGVPLQYFPTSRVGFVRSERFA
ncbi:MAG: antibiotic biosynthesis monooxygenase [Geminicoccus sp.]|nr:antibiotic biosynthesis monooxygenase [Geminicoccus sp.]HCI01447.1 antibiotic biosynthesis monooxygenase [Alphaproteobacteria bacterium]|tara:strand:+ start:95 stop:505 length:411 start_codon:yes stop_codon:yes gene_type:complete